MRPFVPPAPGRALPLSRRAAAWALPLGWAGLALCGAMLGTQLPAYGPKLILVMLGAGVFLIALYRPLGFVFLAIATAPLANVFIMRMTGIQIRMSVVVWWLAAAGSLALVLFGRRKLRVSPVTLLLAAYGLYLALSAFWGVRVSTSIREGIQFYTFVMIFLVVDNMLHAPGLLRKAVDVFIAGAVILIAGYLFGVLVTPILPYVEVNAAWVFRFRWNEGYFHPVTMMTIAGAVTLICAALLLGGQESRARKYGYAAILAFMLLAQAITMKRIELVGLVLGGAVLFSFYEWRKGVFYSSLVGLLVLVTFLLLPDLRQRFADVGDASVERWHYALPAAGMIMWREDPLLGKGAGAYQVKVGEYLNRLGVFDFEVDEGVERDPHQIFVRILADTGLVGLGLFCAFLAALLWRMWQGARSRPRLGTALDPLCRGLLGATLVEIVVSMGQNPQNSNQWWLIMALGYLAATMKLEGAVRPAAEAPGGASAPRPRVPAPARARRPRPALRRPAPAGTLRAAGRNGA